ncbi:glycosyltransferase WbuB [Puteibacter caeruleilacunae]|nr:glycosyltransferase WbuB [Puteibacter caeruleilacunae]
MTKDQNSIVFINQSSGYLMVDIINAFANKYHKRTLITGMLNPRNKPLDEDVSVQKIVAYNRTSNVRRLLSWLVGFLQILMQVWFKHRKAHLFIVTNPPFATLVPMLCRNKFSLLIFDIYPDALVDHNMMSESSFFIKLWKRWNKKVYRRAENVYTLSGGMKGVLSQYVDREKIDVVPIWTDNNFLKPVAKRDNPFVKKQDLQDKFTVLYSGNLGHTHDVEVMVELAKATTDPDIEYVIIGGGEKWNLLLEMITEGSVNNCTLLPWQPTDQLPYTLSSADIAVVTLGKEASKLSVPSKTFNYMSVGAPILAIAEEDAELAQLIDFYKIGSYHSADDLRGMLQFIEQIKSDEAVAKKLQTNVLTASQDFTPENAMKFL